MAAASGLCLLERAKALLLPAKHCLLDARRAPAPPAHDRAGANTTLWRKEAKHWRLTTSPGRSRKRQIDERPAGVTVPLAGPFGIMAVSSSSEPAAYPPPLQGSPCVNVAIFRNEPRKVPALEIDPRGNRAFTSNNPFFGKKSLAIGRHRRVTSPGRDRARPMRDRRRARARGGRRAHRRRGHVTTRDRPGARRAQ